MFRTVAALAVAVLCVSLCGVSALRAADEGDFVKVEVKGILQTGIVAIGGETTGTIIKAGKITWELDLGGKEDFVEFASKHNGKPVIIQGLYTEKAGVEIKVRKIVIVKKMSPAGE